MGTVIQTTLFDIIERNFEAINEKCFIIRAIYAGEHTFPEPKDSFRDYFSEQIKKLTSSYCDAPPFGLLLVNEKYYFVVIEGSEDVITRQIKLLIENDDHKDMFGRSKLFMAYHNICKRRFSSWHLLFVDNQILETKSDMEKCLNNEYDVLKKCIDKIEKICSLALEDDELDVSNVEYSKFVPESALLEYILDSEYITELREYAELFQTLPDFIYSFERCWPAPYDLTPRLVREFSEKFNIVEPLPDEEEDEVVDKAEGNNESDNVQTKVDDDSNSVEAKFDDESNEK